MRSCRKTPISQAVDDCVFPPFATLENLCLHSLWGTLILGFQKSSLLIGSICFDRDRRTGKLAIEVNFWRWHSCEKVVVSAFSLTTICPGVGFWVFTISFQNVERITASSPDLCVGVEKSDVV